MPSFPLGIGIPIIKIRRPHGCLIFILGITVHVKGSWMGTGRIRYFPTSENNCHKITTHNSNRNPNLGKWLTDGDKKFWNIMERQIGHKCWFSDIRNQFLISELHFLISENQFLISENEWISYIRKSFSDIRKSISDIRKSALKSYLAFHRIGISIVYITNISDNIGKSIYWCWWLDSPLSESSRFADIDKWLISRYMYR